jgi:hypothetical protein
MLFQFVKKINPKAFSPNHMPFSQFRNTCGMCNEIRKVFKVDKEGEIRFNHEKG